MSEIKPFKANHPAKEFLSRFSSLSFDAELRADLAKKAKKEPVSYLHIYKPQYFQPNYEQLYEVSIKKLKQYLEEGIIESDSEESLYIYRQQKELNIFTGIICLVSTSEYLDGGIKKHELTRHDKEAKMAEYFEKVRLNGSPVLLTHPRVEGLDKLILDNIENTQPLIHFNSEDGIAHTIWKISKKENILALQNLYKKVSSLYIADGHHRSAAYTDCVGRDGGLMAYILPAEQLKIFSFNRLIKDFGGMKTKEFLKKLSEKFIVSPEVVHMPDQPGIVHMYLKKKWYKIEIPFEYQSNKDHKDNMDVSIIEKHILNEILGIEDSRSSNRMLFINGSIEEEVLTDMVGKGKMKAAFTFYPCSMEDVMHISDHHQTMPPKSTWIEPKLRSGLIMHRF